MRGRPAHSKVRNRIATILLNVNTSYGYEIYKRYRELFGDVKMRTVYYNLRKGVLLNEFIVSDIKREVGNYTWGNETERVYYANGPYANPIRLEEVQIKKLEKTEKGDNITISQEQIERTMMDMEISLDDYILKFRDMPVNTRVKMYKNLDARMTKLRKWLGRNNQDATEKVMELERMLKNYEY